MKHLIPPILLVIGMAVATVALGIASVWMFSGVGNPELTAKIGSIVAGAVFAVAAIYCVFAAFVVSWLIAYDGGLSDVFASRRRDRRSKVARE